MHIARRRPQDYLVAALFLIVVAGLVYAGIYAWRKSREMPPPDVSAYRVRGIDVSAHNGDIDFQKVKKAGMQFVFIKASEGVDFRDAAFAKNFDNARQAGLPIGVYHFYRYDKTGIDQAVNLYHALNGRIPELGVVIDLEDAGNTVDSNRDFVIENLAEMIDYLNLRGLTVTFYTNKDGYYKYLYNNYSGHALWICSFTQQPIDAEWRFWQYSHNGRVPGVSGPVDLNVYRGDSVEWKKFLELARPLPL